MKPHPVQPRSSLGQAHWLLLALVVSSLGIGLRAQTKAPVPKPNAGIVERELKRRAEAAKLSPQVQEAQRLAGILGKDFITYNEKPMKMPMRVAILCTSPDVTVGPHMAEYSRVFSNSLAEESYRKGKANYPVGSILLKAKYADEKGDLVELMTMMVKREKDYNPDHGDWEYKVTNPGGWVYAQGRIDSCVKCHDSFAKTGHVTRWGLDAPKGGERDYSWDKVLFQRAEEKERKP